MYAVISHEELALVGIAEDKGVCLKQIQTFLEDCCNVRNVVIQPTEIDDNDQDGWDVIVCGLKFVIAQRPVNLMPGEEL